MMRQSQLIDPHTKSHKMFVASMRNKRAYNVRTRCYLHLSGEGETATTTFAWIGSERQFNNLRINRSEYTLLDDTEIKKMGQENDELVA